MSKINEKEYMILKNLKEDNCKSIFRDKSIYGRNGDLWASPGDFYKNERERRWFSFKKVASYGVDNNLFQLIQWEDENPYNISELIKEYEFEKILLAMAKEETVLEFKLDSEETKEEQKYYAKIKGHELLSDSVDGCWNVDGKELYIDNDWHDYSGYKTTILTKDEWTNLGINEDNADFVKVEEL